MSDVAKGIIIVAVLIVAAIGGAMMILSGSNHVTCHDCGWEGGLNERVHASHWEWKWVDGELKYVEEHTYSCPHCGSANLVYSRV